MILDLRKEFYFGEDSPLIPDENGNFTRPVNFRKRYYRILKAAGIETKGLHSLRHSVASNLLNDGFTTVQVAEWLGHSSSTTTLKFYAHIDKTSKLAIANSLQAD